MIIISNDIVSVVSQGILSNDIFAILSYGLLKEGEITEISSYITLCAVFAVKTLLLASISIYPLLKSDITVKNYAECEVTCE